jgi:hypothetical protein
VAVDDAAVLNRETDALAWTIGIAGAVNVSGPGGLNVGDGVADDHTLVRAGLQADDCLLKKMRAGLEQGRIGAGGYQVDPVGQAMPGEVGGTARSELLTTASRGRW